MELLYSIIGGLITFLITGSVKKLIDWRRYRHFRQVFGKDVASLNQYHMVYSHLALRPIVSAGKNVTHPYYKLGGDTQISISIENPVSSCEIRAAKYLAEVFGKEVKGAPKITSDKELQATLDTTFISLGGPLSNFKTKDILDNPANHLLDFDNHEFQPKNADVAISQEPEFHYGMILKIHPKQFPQRTWFACAGSGEWGTSGSAWYLANHWQELHKLAGENPFVIIVKVRPGQDESTEVVFKDTSDSF